MKPDLFRRAALLALFLLLAGGAARSADLDLSRYEGKVVVVDFWASWCAPCRQSFPWLNALQQEYADDGLVVIGVNVDRERAEAERFLREHPASFDIVYDPQGALAARQGVMGMPSSFVFDRKGALVASHIGFKTAHSEARKAELVRLLRDSQR